MLSSQNMLYTIYLSKSQWIHQQEHFSCFYWLIISRYIIVCTVWIKRKRLNTYISMYKLLWIQPQINALMIWFYYCKIYCIVKKLVYHIFENWMLYRWNEVHYQMQKYHEYKRLNFMGHNIENVWQLA